MNLLFVNLFSKIRNPSKKLLFPDMPHLSRNPYGKQCFRRRIPLLNVGALYPTTDVIDTYVYRALMNQGNYGMSSAVGLIQSVICCATLVITNLIVKKISPENSLF